MSRRKRRNGRTDALRVKVSIGTARNLFCHGAALAYPETRVLLSISAMRVASGKRCFRVVPNAMIPFVCSLEITRFEYCLRQKGIPYIHFFTSTSSNSASCAAIKSTVVSSVTMAELRAGMIRPLMLMGPPSST